MGLLACTSNTDCQSLLFCAQSPCDAGGAGSCLAACEANDTETVTMAYAQLAACMFMNCPQCPVLPQQPAQSDL